MKEINNKAEKEVNKKKKVVGEEGGYNKAKKEVNNRAKREVNNRTKQEVNNKANEEGGGGGIVSLQRRGKGRTY